MQPKINIECEFEHCLPKRTFATDAGADMVAKENAILFDGVRTLVGTGVKVEIPSGYVGLLFPRSSLSKLGVTMTNSVGVIDSDYRGEIMASLMFTKTANGPVDSIFINKGDRIVQLVILPIMVPDFVRVNNLSNTERGDGGFGSTGKQ